MTISFKIQDTTASSSALYLVRQPLKQGSPITAETSVNHLFIFDTSGSMYADLPRMRSQIIARLPELLKDGDTFSAIWFSGRGETGVIVEGESVTTLKDLKRVKKLIDENLVSRGMTSFRDPLDMVSQVVKRAEKSAGKNPWSMVFMSDGCDNQCSVSDILSAAKSAGANVQSSTFVEYGFYADRPMLTKMAEHAGGSLIFAKDFDAWLPTFEAALTKRVKVGKRVQHGVESKAVSDFVFALHDNDLLTFAVENGAKHFAIIPEGLEEIYYLSNVPVGRVCEDSPIDKAGKCPVSGLYAAMSLWSTRMDPHVVLPILKVLGDVRLIRQFSGAFGKQRYSEFQQEAALAAFNEPSQASRCTSRWAYGYNPKVVPDDDAFTILDLLAILQEDEENLVLLDSPEFKYNRIGRVRLVDEESDTGLRFTPKAWTMGYPIRNLTWNEARPNLSILVRKEGTVDLSGLDTNKSTGPKPIPHELETFIWRNYTLVKDGIVHVDRLPVRVTGRTSRKLIDRGVIPTSINEGVAVLDLSKLPVMNRSMVQTLSACKLFKDHLELMKIQATQKVFKHYAKAVTAGEPKSKVFEALYGAGGAMWLESLGFTDYSGFAPKKVLAAKSGDFYMNKELNVKLKGLSSLPKVDDVALNLKAGMKKKSTLGFKLMEPAIEQVESFLKSDIYLKSRDQPALLSSWLTTETKSLDTERRQRIVSVARAAFTTVVGQVWFTDLKSLDETTLEIDAKPFQDKPLSCEVVMEEKKVDL